MEVLAQGPVAKAVLALSIVAAAGLGSLGFAAFAWAQQVCYLQAFSLGNFARISTNAFLSSSETLASYYLFIRLGFR